MSDQWRGPGWWVGDDGLWYPPTETPEGLADRWKRRPGWIDEHGDDGVGRGGRSDGDQRRDPGSKAAIDVTDGPERADGAELADGSGARRGPISTGTSIIEAATGSGDLRVADGGGPTDHRQLVLDEAFDVIDLRARYREELLAQEPRDADESQELVASVPDKPSSRSGDDEDGAGAGAPRVTEAPPAVDTRAQLRREPGPEPRRPSRPAPPASVGTSSPDPIGPAGDGRGEGAERSAHAPAAGDPIDDRARDAVEQPRSSRRLRSGPVLLLLATALAVASGVLGALWVRERDANEELRLQLEQIQGADDLAAAEIQALSDQIGTLEIRNEQLAQQLQEAQSLVAPVPEGRLSIIDIPFDPVFVDEVRGQFIALGSTGQYVVWGSGVDQQITDSGVVDGTPTGLYAARDQAFVSTDAGQVMVLSLTGGEDGVPITTGRLSGLAQENRQFWGFAPEAGELRRYRSTNGRLTTSVAVPTVVSELTVGAGAVWALGEEDTIYRVNTADFTLTPISAGQDLVAITAGPDALWTLSAADGSLRRVDAVSGEVLVTVPVGRDPIDAEFSGNSIWVALRSGSTLVEVDTRTSAVVSRTSLPAEPVGLSPGETGVLVTLDAEDPLVRVASD